MWNVVNKIAGTPPDVMLYGASGAITGRRGRLYALNFPHRTLLLFFVIPIPAWLFGVLFGRLRYVRGVWRSQGSRTWPTRPPGRRRFRFVYHQRGWNLTRLTAGRIPWPSFRRKPRLRVHEPEEEPSADLSAEVDRILEKIYREGEASLTAKERKTLETASREYQKKKDGEAMK